MSSDNKSDDDLAGYQQVQGVHAGADGMPTGHIDLTRGTEMRPCLMCAAFEKDEKRLIEYLLAKGLKPDENGIFTTPIAKDFPGRQSLKMNPKQFGFCRSDGIATMDDATCAHWRPTTLISDLAAKVRR